MLKTLLSSTIFLTLNGCASRAPTTKFDGKWQICPAIQSTPPLACLNEPDSLKLREILIRCGSVPK